MVTCAKRKPSSRGEAESRAGWLAALAGKLARGRKSGWLAAQEAVKRVAATAREGVKAAKMGVKKTRKFARQIRCVLSEYCDGGGGGC